MDYLPSNEEFESDPRDQDSTNFEEASLPDRSVPLAPRPSSDGRSLSIPNIPYRLMEIGTGLIVQVETELHGRHHLDHFVIEAPEEICEIFVTCLQAAPYEEIRSFLIEDTKTPGSFVRHILDRDLEESALETARNTIVKLTERVPSIEDVAVSPALRRYDLEEHLGPRELHGRVTLLWNPDTNSLDLVVDAVPPHKGYEKLIGVAIPVADLELSHSEYGDVANHSPIEPLLHELYFRGIEALLINDPLAGEDLAMAGGPDHATEPLPYIEAHDEPVVFEWSPFEDPDEAERPITSLGRYVRDQVRCERQISTHSTAYFMREELYPGTELITFAISRAITGERCYWTHKVTTEIASEFEEYARTWVRKLSLRPLERQIETLHDITRHFSEYSFNIHPGGAHQVLPLNYAVSYFNENALSEWLKRLGQHGLPSNHPYLPSCYPGSLQRDLLQDIASYGFMLIEKPKHLTWAALIVRHDLTTNEVGLRLVPSFNDGLGSAWVDVTIPSLTGAGEKDTFDRALRPILTAFSRGQKIGYALEEELENQGIDSSQWRESRGFPLPEDPSLSKTPFIQAAAHARMLIKELSDRLLLRKKPQEALELLTPFAGEEGQTGYYLTVDIAIKNGREFHPVTFEIHPDGVDSATIVSGKIIHCHANYFRHSRRASQRRGFVEIRRLLTTLNEELEHWSERRYSA